MESATPEQPDEPTVGEDAELDEASKDLGDREADPDPEQDTDIPPDEGDAEAENKGDD